MTFYVQVRECLKFGQSDCGIRDSANAKFFMPHVYFNYNGKLNVKQIGSRMCVHVCIGVCVARKNWLHFFL